MNNLKLIVFILIIIINVITFILYGVDKRRAKRKRWRISEKTLLVFTFCGGGLGAILGMSYFHHKTKHLKFRIFVPIFFIMQLILLIYLINW